LVLHRGEVAWEEMSLTSAGGADKETYMK